VSTRSVAQQQSTSPPPQQHTARSPAAHAHAQPHTHAQQQQQQQQLYSAVERAVEQGEWSRVRELLTTLQQSKHPRASDVLRAALAAAFRLDRGPSAAGSPAKQTSSESAESADSASSVALALYEEACAARWTIGVAVHETVAVGLAQRQDWQGVQRVVERMRAGERPMRLRMPFFQGVLVAAARGRALDQVETYYNEMSARLASGELEQLEREAGLRIYTSLTDTYGRLGLWDAVDALWRDMRGHGVEPDLALLRVGAQAALAVGDVERVAAMFHAYRTEPGLLTTEDSQAFASLVLDGLVRFGAWPQLRRVWSDARSLPHLVPAVHRAVITRLAELGDVDQALLFFEDLRADASALRAASSELPALATTLLSALGRHARWPEVDALWGSLGDVGVTPNVVHYSAVVSSAAQQGSLDTALQYYERMLGDANILLTAQQRRLFTTLGTTFGAAGRWTDVQRFLDDMRAHSLGIDHVLMGALVHVAARAGRVDEMLALYGESRRLGHRLSLSYYTTMAACLGRAERWADVDALFADLKAARVAPDAPLLTACLHAAASTGTLDRAETYFAQLRGSATKKSGAGAHVQVPVYLTMVQELGSRWCWQRLDTLLHDLDESAGEPLAPRSVDAADEAAPATTGEAAAAGADSVADSGADSGVGGKARGGRRSQRKAAAAPARASRADAGGEVVRVSPLASRAVLNALISAAARHGFASVAERYYGELLQRHDVRPDYSLFVTMLLEFGVQRRWDVVERVWADMRRLGALQPPARAKARAAADAAAVATAASAAAETALGAGLSASHYNAVISTAAKTGAFDVALRYFNELLEETARADSEYRVEAPLVNTLATAFAQAGRWADVERVVQHAAGRDVAQDARLCTAVVSAAAQAGELERAQHLYAQLRPLLAVPVPGSADDRATTVPLFMSLVIEFGVRGRWQAVRRFWHEAEAAGVLDDARMYNAALSTAARAHAADELQFFYEEARVRVGGCSALHLSTLSQMVTTLTDLGRTEQLEQLWRDAAAHDMAGDLRLYRAMTRSALSAAGVRPQRARRLRRGRGGCRERRRRGGRRGREEGPLPGARAGAAERAARAAGRAAGAALAATGARRGAVRAAERRGAAQPRPADLHDAVGRERAAGPLGVGRPAVGRPAGGGARAEQHAGERGAARRGADGRPRAGGALPRAGDDEPGRARGGRRGRLRAAARASGDARRMGQRVAPLARAAPQPRRGGGARQHGRARLRRRGAGCAARRPRRAGGRAGARAAGVARGGRRRAGRADERGCLAPRQRAGAQQHERRRVRPLAWPWPARRRSARACVARTHRDRRRRRHPDPAQLNCGVSVRCVTRVHHSPNIAPRLLRGRVCVV
jgi:pentatricopeptide repeat protein